MGLEVTIDGKKAFAATGGRQHDSSLPAVAFVHGAGMDHTVWALQSRYFAHHGRAVLALDLPGHGRSEGPPLESIEEIADWIIAFAEAAELSEIALTGHSMGAIACLEAAARHPDKVRALALLGVAPAMPVHPDMLASAKENGHLAIDMINAWGHGSGAHNGGNILSGSWLIGGGNRLLERAKPGAIAVDLAACGNYKRGPEAAGEVKCPAMIIMGAEDKMTPAKGGRKMSEAIADSKAVFLPDCGHMMMTEKPEATLDALKQIL